MNSWDGRKVQEVRVGLAYTQPGFSPWPETARSNLNAEPEVNLEHCGYSSKYKQAKKSVSPV